MYHNTAHTISPYRGAYDTQGGPVGAGAEAGASGTTYILHASSNHSTLRVDNRNRKPITEHTAIQNIGWRHDLSAEYSTLTKSNVYVPKAGFKVTSSSAVYNYHQSGSWCPNPIPNNGRTYLLGYLFDQTLHNDPYQYFMAGARTTTLTIQLDKSYFINTVRVYPNKDFPTKFKVSA